MNQEVGEDQVKEEDEDEGGKESKDGEDLVKEEERKDEKERRQR